MAVEAFLILRPSYQVIRWAVFPYNMDSGPLYMMKFPGI